MSVSTVCLCALLIGAFTEMKVIAEAQYSTTPLYPAHSTSSTAFDPNRAFNPYTAHLKPSYAVPVYHKLIHPTQEHPAAPSYHRTAERAYPETYEANDERQYRHCDAGTAPTCSRNGTDTFCLEDSEYPWEEVKYAIDYDPLVLNKYVDVADQSADNLVAGLTSLAEEHFDYSNYQGSSFEEDHWLGDEGYICPSDVVYARPVRAVNDDGQWRVIVQDMAWPGYTQTQRIEICLFAGASCRTLAPCYQSQCVQQYVYQRLLSFNPCDPQRGIFVDIYKLPSACSCHIHP